MEDGNEIVTGHWQPALRPDVLTPAEDQAEIVPESTSSNANTALSTGSAHVGISTGQPSGPAVKPKPQAVGISIHNQDELPSDEDDERLDPAWGITRMDSEQVLQKVHRSNSFPDFGAFGAPDSAAAAVALPASQAQQVMTGQDEGRTNIEDPVQQRESIITDAPEPADTDGSQTYPVNGTSPEHPVHDLDGSERERFDEGVPLIPTESQEIGGGVGGYAHSTAEAAFEGQFEDEDAGFFSAPAGHSSDNVAVPHLDRKSTTDIFDSLHFSQMDPPDSPGPVEADSNAERQSEPQAKDEVADDEMWKAALDDDEFLVEDADDLLPDSEPGSPSSFLESLKEETPSQALEEPDSKLITTPKRDQRPEFARQAATNPYAPHQPSTSDLTQLSPTSYSNIGLTRPALAPLNSFQQHLQQRPPPPQPAQSFADQSKGGYKSPYDMPLELSKPRKRPQAITPSIGTKTMPPPPRSSSISDKPLQSPFSPTAPTAPGPGRTSSVQPPPQSNALVGGAPAASQPNRPVRSSSSFFEELPITQRPRPASVQPRYTPTQTSAMPPPQLLPGSPPQQKQESPQQSSPPISQPSKNPYAQYQLRPPERLDPYSNVPLQTVPTAPVQTPSTRYSPAPTSTLAGPKPAPSPRYSPAPPPQPNTTSATRYASQPNVTNNATPLANRHPSQPTNPPPSNVLPFQPRTSSPLAYHGKIVQQQESQPTISSIVGSGPASAATESTVPHQSIRAPPSGVPQPSSTAKQAYSDYDSFYASRSQPPRRSQTQSPGKQMPKMIPLLAEENGSRPASVHSSVPPPRSFASLETLPPPRSHVRQRGLSQSLNFIEPADGQQLDPLQRWKGAPIFKFGFGGTIISSFPRHVPRYTAGGGLPMIKPSVGEVNVRELKATVGLPELLASFPGPLRTKAKKKDVLNWMTNYIAMMEQEAPSLSSGSLVPDPIKRYDEKILLWKIVRAFVEHDGILDTGAEARRAINTILSPDLFALDDTTATQYRDDFGSIGIYQPAGHVSKTDPVDPVTTESIRKHLLRGEREKAVWLAVDNRLWSHALLISSTLDRTVWKQVVQEFVRQEVKVIGANTESLAAVYEIFAGNLEESIDELVPPSARAGLQMVSKVNSGGPVKNALDGLDKWRETLALILNNRAPDDARALSALGRLLSSYGRVEAAHICQIFARGPLYPNVFGGLDDPQASIVLLGGDHLSQPTTFFHSVEAILLTEVYEFATSVLTSGVSALPLPHLQVFKLHRALILTENGQKAEAQGYCEAIANSLKTSTKVSPYFHPILLGQLDELSNRLKQVPVQGSSWIAKPSIEKVSGSVWNKFSSFVAGEDSDAESKGSGRDAVSDIGPFAKVTSTPSLSRSASQSDLYGSYAVQTVPNTLAGSRYAPNGLTTARSSSELTRGRASLELQRSPPSTAMSPTYQQSSLDPAPSLQATIPPLGSSPYQSLSQSPPTNRYQATPPQTSYVPNMALQTSPHRPKRYESYIPTPPPEQAHTDYPHPPPPAPEPESVEAEYPTYHGHSSVSLDEQPPGPDDIAQPSSYEPVQSYGYEPPSSDTGYVPYQPEPESDEEPEGQKIPNAAKKSSFLDDNDDFARIPETAPTTVGPAPPAPTHPPTKSGDTDADAEARRRANDAAAEAAFRAAAAADAARNKEQEKTIKPKGSWFGGWLGVTKKPDALDAAAKDGGKTVHRAHLGESKMKFVYDEKLKRWVNPDDPDSMKSKAATPPPPKMGGASRGLTPSVSLPLFPGGGPPSSAGNSGPPSRVSTPADSGPLGPPFGPAPTSVPSATASLPSIPQSGPGAAAVAPPLAPPSRPSTSLSDASSIDDLLGGPATGRRTIKGKKGAAKGRYIDVMAK